MNDITNNIEKRVYFDEGPDTDDKRSCHFVNGYPAFILPKRCRCIWNADFMVGFRAPVCLSARISGRNLCSSL